MTHPLLIRTAEDMHNLKTFDNILRLDLDRYTGFSETIYKINKIINPDNFVLCSYEYNPNRLNSCRARAYNSHFYGFNLSTANALQLRHLLDLGDTYNCTLLKTATEEDLNLFKLLTC